MNRWHSLPLPSVARHLRRSLAVLPLVAALAACDDGAAGTKDPEPAPPDEQALTTPVKGEFDDVAYAPKCKPFDDGTNCIEVHPDAVRIDDELKLGWKNIEVDRDKGTLEFDLAPGVTLDPRLRQGGFVYRGRKDKEPVLHRIQAFDVEGQHVRLKIEKAKAKDVFTKVRVRTRVPLVEPTPPAPANFAWAALGAEIGIGPRNCAGTVFDAAPIVFPNSHVTLDLTTCRFRLTAWADVILKWDPGIANLDQVEVVIGGGIDAALTAALTVELQGGFAEEKAITTPVKVPFAIGPIPFTATLTVFAGYYIGGTAEFSASAGFEYNKEVSVGFGWSDVNDFYTVRDVAGNGFTPIGPNVYFDGNLTATAWLRPRFDVQLLDIVGGYIDLKTFVQATLSSTASANANGFSGEVCADLKLGLTPSVGVSADILGLTLFDVNQPITTVAWTLVEDACTEWNGAGASDCAPSSECCVDGQCAPDTNDPGSTVDCVRSASKVGDLYEYHCDTQHTEGYCNSGGDFAQLVCDQIDDDPLTTHRCIDDHCELVRFGPPRDPPVDIQPNEDIEIDNCVVAPNCCYTNSDCADGIERTIDTCEKEPVQLLVLGEPVSGTCKNWVPGVAEQF